MSFAETPRGRLGELRAAVRLAVRRGWEDNLPQMAGSLAYTLVFAIFPALIFLVAVLDLVGWFVPAIEDAMRWIGEQPADSPWRSLEAPLNAVLEGSTPAWAMLIFGGLITLWTAGNYVGGYQWAVGRIRRIPAGHPFVKQRILQHALAIGAFVVILVTVVVVVFTGPVAEHLGDRIGLGDTTTLVWSWLRWPILFVVVSLLFAVFYQVTPGARRERSGLFTTGSAVAVIGWLLFTGGFSLYVKYFADYNRLYGTLGAFIAFLIWLYLFNVALLAATEIDAALEEVRAGAPASQAGLANAASDPADAHNDDTKVDEGIGDPQAGYDEAGPLV